MAFNTPTQLGASVAQALSVLQRDMVRLYETMRVAGTLGHDDILWRCCFYLRWTYMAMTRFNLTGYTAEQAFKDRAETFAAALVGKPQQPLAKYTPQRSDWIICYACAAVNTHKSPACPIVTSPTPTTVPTSTRAAVKATIAAAPIPQTKRDDLQRIADLFYAKIDRASSDTRNTS